MARMLDIPRALSLMPHPQHAGSYVIEVEDVFLPEVGGRWRVSFDDQNLARVAPTGDNADLAVSEQALVQLVTGRTGLSGALFRHDVRVFSNETLLRETFTQRNVCLSL